MVVLCFARKLSQRKRMCELFIIYYSSYNQSNCCPAASTLHFSQHIFCYYHEYFGRKIVGLAIKQYDHNHILPQKPIEMCIINVSFYTRGYMNLHFDCGLKMNKMTIELKIYVYKKKCTHNAKRMTFDRSTRINK